MVVRPQQSLSRSICELHLLQQEHTNVGTRPRSSKPAGSRGEAAVDCHRAAASVMGSLRSLDRACDGGDGCRGRRLRSRALGHSRALARCFCPRRKLVRRQSRRHAGPCSQGRAPEVRLLSRSRPRHRRRHVAVWRAGSVDIHVASHRAVAAGGVSARVRRGVPRDGGQRCIQDGVRRRRSNRAPDSAGNRDDRAQERSACQLRFPPSNAAVRLRGAHRNRRPGVHIPGFGHAECGRACAAGAASATRRA